MNKMAELFKNIFLKFCIEYFFSKPRIKKKKKKSLE